MKKTYPIRASKVKPFIGRQICAVLHDGSYYIGTVSKVKNGHLILNGFKGNGKVSANRQEAKAQISAMGLGSLFGMPNAGMFGQGKGQGGGLFGGMGTGAGLGGLGAGFGGLGKGAGAGLGGLGLGGIGSGLRVGFGMLSFLVPLLGRFFI